jgi:hypothetical protein
MTDRDTPTLQRLVWRHINSGVVPIQGAGLSSNTQRLSVDDAIWLNEMFPELEFRLEEWNQSEGMWIEVPDD